VGKGSPPRPHRAPLPHKNERGVCHRGLTSFAPLREAVECAATGPSPGFRGRGGRRPGWGLLFPLYATDLQPICNGPTTDWIRPSNRRFLPYCSPLSFPMPSTRLAASPARVDSLHIKNYAKSDCQVSQNGRRCLPGSRILMLAKVFSRGRFRVADRLGSREARVNRSSCCAQRTRCGCCDRADIYL